MITLEYDPSSDVLYVRIGGSNPTTSRTPEDDANFILNLDEYGSIVGVQWISPHQTPEHSGWRTLPEGIRNIIENWFSSQDKFYPWTTLQIQTAKLFL